MNELKQADGYGDVRIAYQVMGHGPAVILIHGFLSSARMNWASPGISRAIASAGFQIILPDLRGHGQSGAPEHAAAYPPDILAMDMEAVLAAEQVSHYHLVGYSLGARTAVRMVVRGARPEKMVLGGMGLSGILNTDARRDYFITAIDNRDRLQRGDAGYEVARFIKSTGTNPMAAIHALRSQVNSSLENQMKIVTPTLVIAGDKDHDNGSARDLAAAMPNATYSEINGDHMSAVINPTLGTEILGFIRA